MLINGEKYACEACVRGHRVSNCQHRDRPLQRINKKGRPVSQCHHCRTMRKSRAAHVKCDCGERSSKCAHLQNTVEGHRETCCCNHGGRCTCAHKKESPGLDTVPESESDGEPSRVPKPTARRRRANTVHSDGTFSFDKNGLRTSQRSKTSQSSYQLQRVNSVNSTASTASLASEGGPVTGAREIPPGRLRTGGSRRVRSATASPQISRSPTFPQLITGLPPLDMSRIQPYPSWNTDFFGSSTFSSDQEPALFSAGLSAASGDWGTSDGLASSSWGHATHSSYSSFPDWGNGSEPMPNLASTTTNSGDVSEAEDNILDGLEYVSHRGDWLRGGPDYETFKVIDDGPLSLVEDDPAFFIQNYNEESAEVLNSTSDSGYYTHYAA